MARFWFGGGTADYVVVDGGDGAVELAPATNVLFYNQGSGGTQYTDLLDEGAAPVTQVTTDDEGNIPRFQGPDGVSWLWADASGGLLPRRIMMANDLGDHLTDPTIDYNDLTNKPKFTLPFGYSGILSTYTGTVRYYNDTGRTWTVNNIRATVGVAPVGASVIIDVNKNGTTLFTTQANRPTIGAGTTTDTGSPDIATVADGDYLTVDIDQVGTTTPGTDLLVTVTVT